VSIRTKLCASNDALRSPSELNGVPLLYEGSQLDPRSSVSSALFSVPSV
jgi:hypothetical protein